MFWDFIESPLAYVMAVILAISMFIDYNRGAQSIVNSSIKSIRQMLLDLGDKGLRASLGEFIDIESNTVQWTIAIVALVVNVVTLHKLWNWINNYGAQEGDDAPVPTAEATK